MELFLFGLVVWFVESMQWGDFAVDNLVALPLRKILKISKGR
jgi:hypothetical protein